MTLHDLLHRAINKAGSRAKLARHLTTAGAPVTERTIYNWQHIPMRIRFAAIHEMCKFVEADQGALVP